MSDKKQTVNPTAFIAIGICYVGAGVALAAALPSRGGPAIGIALIGVGITFLVIGVVNRKNPQSGE